MNYKKLLWILVSCLMVLSLVIASCSTSKNGGGKVIEEDTGQTVTIGEEQEEETTVDQGEDTSSSEGPVYDGVISLVINDVSTFDETAAGMHAGAHTVKLTNEELLTGDWARGPAGTNESSWASNGIDRIDLKTGSLAESWEIPEVGTIVLNIRQGVHYALANSEASRLVNGRELTANDITETLNRAVNNPKVVYGYADTRFAVATTLDNYTVKIELPQNVFIEVLRLCDYLSIFPPEVTERYGDMLDWENSVGTGPFVITDYTTSSSATLKRNDNYWGTNPVGPNKGDQLPYLNGVKFLIIVDASSRMAGFRTGKIDVIHDLAYEDADLMMKQNPDLLMKERPTSGGNAMYMRLDKPELPFADINVRRAMMMATDFETINESYFHGKGQILTYPIPYNEEYADAYLPLDEAPESVQELYIYNPEKATQLLTDAGFPDGFQTSLVCSNDPATVDYLSIVKDMWSKVGIDLQLDVMEGGAYFGFYRGRRHEEMMYSPTGPIGSVFFGNAFGGNAAANASYIDDAKCNEARDQMRSLAVADPVEASRIHKELMAYVLAKVYAIPGVQAPMYHLWWPWVKDYHGELSPGYDNSYHYTKYVWLDTNLKKSMGY